MSIYANSVGADHIIDCSVFPVRCIRNCGHKINPQKQIAVVVECFNCGNSTMDMEYTWLVTGLDNQGPDDREFELSKDTVTGM